MTTGTFVQELLSLIGEWWLALLAAVWAILSGG